VQDPAGVKALLDQLKSSQAWQETLNCDAQPGPEQNAEAQGPLPSSSAEDGQSESTTRASDITPSASVATLLSQLRSSEWTSIPVNTNTPPASHTSPAHASSQHIHQPLQEPLPFQPEQRPPRPAAASSTSMRVQDVRSLSFQQALPHLTQLSGNPEFVASIVRLQQEQKDLEQQLWEERHAIHKKHEEKVKVARTKAGLIGAGLSKHEADMMNDAYRRDLQRFGAERALLAWDGLIQKQQAALEALGVPTMFPTSSQAHCEQVVLRVSTFFSRGNSTSGSAGQHMMKDNCLQRLQSLDNICVFVGDKVEAQNQMMRNGSVGSAGLFCQATDSANHKKLTHVAILRVESWSVYPPCCIGLFSHMPYIDIPSHDDYLSIWYITDSDYGNVGSFDPEKPTVVILHPLFLDSSWLTKHFDDPRLSSEYNLIAFDQRTQGRSRCRPNAVHDCYVDAADLALAMQTLLLPPSHFLAFECISVNCVLRLTAMWPELALSMTLCNVPPPTELKWVFNAYDELLQLWCHAADLDSFEHAGNEVVTFMTGETDNIDLQDDLIAYWEVVTPPGKRLRIVELVNIMMNRTPLNTKELAKIRCPVLIIQNEHSPVAPLTHAESLRDHIRDATGQEPRLYVIKGSYLACMSIIPGSASLVNRVLAGFLSQLPRARSDLVPPPIPIFDRTKIALQTLSELVGDPSIARRNPRSSLSFSCVTPEVAKSQLESLKFYAKEIDKTYCPLGRDGRPIRKYSERKQSHWFHGDNRGISHLFAAQQKFRSRSPERPVAGSLTANGTDLVTEAVAQDGRMRRTTHNTSSVEKQVIKGSMSKVVTQSAALKVNGQGIPIPKVLL
ncbi:alpha/beta-hydrolase, partial [Gyrodon lividus]